MENNIILKKTPYLGVLSSFIVGLFIHCFGLVNVLHNHDNIYRVAEGYGSGVHSGRWFLTILGDFVDLIFGGHNLAWLNGVVFIAILAISAGLLISTFHVKSRLSAVLIGICMVAYPSVAATLFYRFTSVYYGVAILLAILAGYVIEKYNSKIAFPVAIICIALSMGIYQAYVSFTITIFLLLLLKVTLDGNTSPKKVITTGIYYVLVIALGAILYLVVMKLSLVVYDVVLTDYKGMNDMGISVAKIPSLIASAFLPILKLPMQDYEDVAKTVFVGLCYLAIYLIIAIRLFVLFFKKTQKIINVVFALLLCAILPLALNFVVVLCGRDMVYILMLYPLVMILFIPILFEEWLPNLEGKWELLNYNLKRITVVILLIVSCLYTYQINTNYTMQYYNNELIKNYYNRMITQVQMTPGYDTSKKIVFIGKNQDPLLTKSWNAEERFGGNMELERLIDFRREYWIKEYIGATLPLASDSEKESLLETDVVKNMVCWPNYGSVQIINDYVVIKLSE